MINERAPSRIFFVIDTLKTGGAQQQLLYLIQSLESAGHRTALCSLWPLMKWQDRFFQAGTHLVYVHKRSRLDISIIWRLASAMRQFRPDIVHTWLTTGNLWGRLAARLARVPVVIASVRTVSPGDLPASFVWIDRLLARMTDTLICNSRAGCLEVQGAHIHARRGCRVVYNGLDASAYADADAKQADRGASDGYRRQLGLRPAGPVVGTVGRLVPQKDHRTFLEAMGKVHDGGVAAQAVIVGEGDLRPALEVLCGELGLRDSVVFAGARSDVPALMHLFDVFVLSSLWEGLSNVSMEAMAAGRPVVATDVGGTAELVETGMTGLLVPPGDPDRLAGAVLALLRDPARARRMGEAGQQRVVSQFSLERMVSETENIYTELLSLKGGYPESQRP